MVDNQNWITLTRNSEIYTQKPPFFFWLISFFSIILGRFSELSARLPSAFAGTGSAIITYLLAKKLFNEKTALYSSLILVTSLAFLAASQWVILDPVLTFLVVTAVYLLYIGLHDKKKRTLTYSFAFISMGLATLTKGPVGIILPFLTIAIYAFWTKKTRSLFTREALLGSVIFTLIILAWLIPACVRGGEAFTKDLLLKQVFGRFFKAFDHKEPLYFYFIRFPLEFLPWTIFLPTAAVFLAKNKKREDSVRFIFVWFAVIFLFFTFSKSKNDLYILPAYPAAAMCVAYYFENCIKKFRTVIAVVCAMLIINTVLGYYVLPLFDKYKSPKYFAEKIVRHISPGDELLTFNINPVYWLYYCGQKQMGELKDYPALEEYLRSKKRVFCIINKNDYEKFGQSFKAAKAYLIETAPWGIRGVRIKFEKMRAELTPKETLVLISNREG